MSKADDHAQDLAEFLYFDNTTTDFAGENLQEVLNNISAKSNGVHTGEANMENVRITNDLYVVNRILVANGGRLVTNGEFQAGGEALFISAVEFRGDVTFDASIDFLGSNVDFSGATVVGLDADSTLPDWTQAYKFLGSPSSAPQSININRSILKGKEILVVLYDPDNVDEISVVIGYYPEIGNSIPPDHSIVIGVSHDDGQGYPIEYQNGTLDANRSKVLLVLVRDPVIHPKGGISFDASTSIQWSN
ncbi:hypothetical protein GD1_239 [Paraglaciecola Antarctic GD virus 1]|nr:hypothetical protein GD1_239 [Paraglaciecola Antarctic GD virus 1]